MAKKSSTQFLFNPHPRICSLIWGDGEKEREREIDVREKRQSVASCVCPDQGLNLKPFGLWGNMPTNGATQPGLKRYVFDKVTKHPT